MKETALELDLKEWAGGLTMQQGAKNEGTSLSLGAIEPDDEGLWMLD